MLRKSLWTCKSGIHSRFQSIRRSFQATAYQPQFTTFTQDLAFVTSLSGGVYFISACIYTKDSLQRFQESVYFSKGRAVFPKSWSELKSFLFTDPFDDAMYQKQHKINKAIGVINDMPVPSFVKDIMEMAVVKYHSLSHSETIAFYMILLNFIPYDIVVQLLVLLDGHLLQKDL